ncbi:MAG: IS1595 family transposase [Nitrospinae bacterium]|nr:IS1595 family transposase [Nitrospinota bacterium]
MAHTAPGKAYRKGISLLEIIQRFPDEKAAEQWFIKTRWPVGVCCPECGSLNVQERKSRKPQPYRCRDCRKDFSIKTGTLMEGSKISLQKWAIAFYLSSTNLKGVSSMKLHRDLGVTQKTAWFMMHRIRETWRDNGGMFTGPCEADESYFGGKRKNMPKSKRENLKGRGTVDKAIVAGVKDRDTNQIKASVVESTDRETLQGFIKDNVKEGAKVYTDDHASYQDMPGFDHEAVKHSVGEYVREQAHTNGVESFWAMLKRAHKGTFHKMSHKHLERYVNEFAGRHNIRPLDTIDQMESIVSGMHGKRLRYDDLVA